MIEASLVNVSFLLLFNIPKVQHRKARFSSYNYQNLNYIDILADAYNN